MDTVKNSFNLARKKLIWILFFSGIFAMSAFLVFSLMKRDQDRECYAESIVFLDQVKANLMSIYRLPDLATETDTGSEADGDIPNFDTLIGSDAMPEEVSSFLDKGLQAGTIGGIYYLEDMIRPPFKHIIILAGRFTEFGQINQEATVEGNYAAYVSPDILEQIGKSVSVNYINFPIKGTMLYKKPISLKISGQLNPEDRLTEKTLFLCVKSYKELNMLLSESYWLWTDFVKSLYYFGDTSSSIKELNTYFASLDHPQYYADMESMTSYQMRYELTNPIRKHAEYGVSILGAIALLLMLLESIQAAVRDAFPLYRIHREFGATRERIFKSIFFLIFFYTLLPVIFLLLMVKLHLASLSYLPWILLLIYVLFLCSYSVFLYQSYLLWERKKN